LGPNVRCQNEIIEGRRLQGGDEEEKGVEKQEIIATGWRKFRYHILFNCLHVLYDDTLNNRVRYLE
jgi:hypothetical protein